MHVYMSAYELHEILFSFAFLYQTSLRMYASAYTRLRDVRISHRASKRVEKFLLRKL